MKKCRLFSIQSDSIFRFGIFLSVGFTVMLFQLMWGLTAAWAGPPFFTDDPEPPDYKHGEFYLSSQFQHSRDGNSGALSLIELNYGLLPNVHFHLIAPLQYDQPEGESAQYGFGDLEFGIKFRFIQETDSVPMVGTFPIILFPTGDKDKGLGSGETQVFLPLTDHHHILISAGRDIDGPNLFTAYLGYQFTFGLKGEKVSSLSRPIEFH